jgi:hypothetical protein
MRGLAGVLVFAVAAGVASSGWARSGGILQGSVRYVLYGSVSPGGSVALKDGTGGRFTTGRAGMYLFIVRDRSPRAGFRLTGPGIDLRVTSAAFVGSRAEGVKLGRGTYTYRSDSQPPKPSGTFALTG